MRGIPARTVVMIFRPASQEDVELLRGWRNDPETLRASFHSEAVSASEHRRWLERVLGDPDETLLIAALGETPVGTLRAVRIEDSLRLSWTVAPQARGRGVGKAMVRAWVEGRAERILAEVKQGNEASAAIARGAGLCCTRQQGGVLYFERGARRSAGASSDTG